MSHPSLPAIGLLGGSGTIASARCHMLLVQAVVRHLRPRTDQDFPPILCHDIPLPGMSEEGICDMAVVIPALDVALRGLSAAGARHVLVACNSLHVPIEDGQVGVPPGLVSLPSVLTQALSSRGAQKVGVLCARTARDLYWRHAEGAGIECLLPSEEDQKRVDAIICNAMRGKRLLRDRKWLQSWQRSADSTACQFVIAGCTEISWALSPLRQVPSPWVDPFDIACEHLLSQIHSGHQERSDGKIGMSKTGFDVNACE